MSSSGHPLLSLRPISLLKDLRKILRIRQTYGKRRWLLLQARWIAFSLRRTSVTSYPSIYPLHRYMARPIVILLRKYMPRPRLDLIHTN